MAKKFVSTRGPAVEEDADSGGDSLAPLRRCNTRCLGFIVMSKYVSILFAMLPGIYLSCILMWLNTPTGLPAAILKAYAANTPGADPNDASQIQAVAVPMAKSMTQFVGCLTGFTLLFNVTASVCIWLRWCGALSVCNWTTEVVGHFFIVLFIILLLSSATAFQSLPGIKTWEYNLYIGIVVGTLLPACFIWTISSNVITQRRIKMSEEAGESS